MMQSKPAPAELNSLTPRPTPKIIQFGVFTVDSYAHELYKGDRKIKLQQKPFQVLEMLLQRAGEVVTRNEFCQSLWSPDTFVDFDHNLKTAVRRVRAALGDSADSPRYIETLPGRGYRFIAPVQRLNRWPSATDLPRKVRLAVLPFDHPHDDADLDEFFSDGMTDAAISQLGCLCPRQLGVIARTSVMHYKHTEKTIGQIGQELDVDYVLEGGIRRAGSLVRIGVRLVQVSDETLVWAGSYDRELANNAVAIQHSVALSISRSPDIVALLTADRQEDIHPAPISSLQDERLQHAPPSRDSTTPHPAG
jgi:TolB-like protein